jgi:hypothetical protein
MRRFVFLDMDGVVNSAGWLQDIDAGRAKHSTVRLADRQTEVLVDPAKVGVLNMLARPGIEWTPVLRTYSRSAHVDWSRWTQPSRGDEILAWLEANEIRREQFGKDVSISIIDDDDDIEPLKEHWVAVDEKVGFTTENALRAWSLLDEVVLVVDDLLPRPEAKLKIFRAGSCHLMSNGYSDKHLDALHKLAARIGLQRKYFQPHRIAPHYDLTKGRREAAVLAGAVEVPARSMLEELRRLRSS